MLGEKEKKWLLKIVEPVYNKYSKGNDEYNISEKEIKERIDIFDKSLEVAKYVEDEKDLKFEYIRLMPDNFEQIISELTAGRLVKPGDFLILEPYLKFLAYLKNKNNFHDNMLMFAYKRLEILGNPYTPQNADKYLKLSFSKEEKNSPFITFDDPKHPENTLKDKTRIMPFVKAYVGRNTIAHGKVIKPTPEDDKNGETVKTSTDEHFNCVCFTCIEQAKKLRTKIIEEFNDVKNEYELLKKYINQYIENYEKSHKKDSYIPLEVEFASEYKSLEKFKKPEMTTEYINNLIEKDLEEDNRIKFSKDLNFNIVKFIGYAGIGKTTFLEYITYMDLLEIKKAKTTCKKKIPIFIKLINIDDENYYKEIEQIIAETVDVDVNTIKLFIKNKKVKIYFDGLNEVQLDEKKKKKFYNKILDFVNTYKDIKILVTDREDREGNRQSIMYDYPTIMMVGVTKNIRDEFIRRNSDYAEDIIKVMNQDSNKFDKFLLNPYFLKEMMLAIEKNGKMPKNMRDFRRIFLEAIIDREIVDKKNEMADYLKDMLAFLVSKKYDPNDLLTDINFKISKDEVIEILKKYKVKSKDESIVPEKMLDLAIELGILEKNNNMVSFKAAEYYSEILVFAKNVKYIK